MVFGAGQPCSSQYRASRVTVAVILGNLDVIDSIFFNERVNFYYYVFIHICLCVLSDCASVCPHDRNKRLKLQSPTCHWDSHHVYWLPI